MTDSSLQRLLTIMKTLRDPQAGCPWDKEQTFETIAPYTLEETYEVLDAIARKDYDDMRDELGDLLFQVVFYAQMGSEQVLANWEKTKSAERAEKAQHSTLDDIPESLPALMRAYKIQKRCAAVGFDWTTLGPVVDKVHEELDEVMHEANQAVVDEAKLEEEIGDLLFATVNLSRHLGSKAEIALQKANRKFERRFREVEKIIAAQGLKLEDATLDQMEAAWCEVKSQESDY